MARIADSQARWQVATSIALLVAVLPGHADAQAGFVLPREAEGTVGAMLAAVELPDGCEWLGAQIDQDRVRASYRCEAGPFELVLVHGAVAPPGATRTDHFALLESADAPRELTDAFLTAVRAHERGDIWRYVGTPSTERESTRTIRAGTWGGLLLALFAIALGGLLTRRRRQPASMARAGNDDAGDETSLGPLLVLLGAVWLGSVLVMLVTFRFVMDDFVYLTTAIADPWTADTELRVLGVRLPFFAGTRGTGTAPFLALNLAAYAGVLAATAALSRRLGGQRHEALLAALIVGLHPGFFELVRYASGFQQLLALALVLSSLLAFDHAAARPDLRGRVGSAILGVGLALAAVLTKYATAALIPLVVFLWSARSASSWKAIAARSLPAVLVGALMLGPLVYAEVDIVGDRAGAGGLGSNASRLALGSGELLLRCLVVVALFLIARVATVPKKDRRRVVRAWFEQSVTRRAETVPFVMVAATTAGLFALPFLLNERYFKDYYVAFAALWVGIWGARAIARACPPERRWWRWGPTLVLVLALAPVGAIEEAFAPTPRNEIGEWLAEAGEVLSDVPRMRSIGLEARCLHGGNARDSERLLAEYHQLDERGHGIRWVAGLDPGVRVTLEGETEVTLYYCESETPRFTLAETAPGR